MILGHTGAPNFQKMPFFRVHDLKPEKMAMCAYVHPNPVSVEGVIFDPLTLTLTPPLPLLLEFLHDFVTPLLRGRGDLYYHDLPRRLDLLCPTRIRLFHLGHDLAHRRAAVISPQLLQPV